MAIVLPDPRLEHPNLLIPYRQPACCVVVDQSHPIVQSAGDTLRVLIPRQGEAGNSFNARGIGVSLTGTAHGLGWDCPGASYGTIPDGGSVLEGATEFTICLAFIPYSIGGNDMVFHAAQPSTSYNGGIAIWPDNLGSVTGASNCLSLWIEGARQETGANTCVANELNVFVITYRQNDHIRTYKKGALIADGADSGNVASAVSTDDGSLRIGGADALNDFDGAVLYAAYCAKALSRNMAESLSESPYQILIPA